MVFSISMALVEAGIVIYLRALYYPEGFSFPLKIITTRHLIFELARETATILMLISVSALIGKSFWEKFAYFLILFGFWDIFYYIWLKIAIGWPLSLLDWDILFLIPLPWIGPVIAPVTIAIMMILAGLFILFLFKKGYDFVLEMIHEFFQEKKGLHKRITLPELAQIFDQISTPEEPHLIKDVLQEIKDKVTVHSVKVGSPHYIGHMISAIPYFMILLEIIIAALNQNQVKIETAKASSFVEREFIAWMHRIIFNRDDTFYRKNIHNPRIALGNITSGGTISNLTALMVARERAFPADRNFPGIRKIGVEGALNYYGYSKMVVLVSRRGHYSIRKAANLLGIGEKNVIYIPVDTYNRINIKGGCLLPCRCCLGGRRPDRR